jgi:glycosyltransferase involved in cell wall biosynthesis
MTPKWYIRFWNRRQFKEDDNPEKMERKNKILYSLSEFMHGSKVAQVCQLVSGLNKDLFEIEICAESIVDEAVDDIKALNIPYYISPFFPPRSFNLKRWSKFILSPIFLLSSHFDIVHSLHYSSICLEAILCKLTKTRYIYSKSNLQWENHETNWKIKSRLADKIISQSGSGYSLLKQKSFSDKTVNIFNGVDCDRYVPVIESEKRQSREKFKIKNSHFVFGYAAHFIEVKDHFTLLKAYKTMKDDYPEISLIFCGGAHDREYHKRVMDFINQNNLSSDVKLLGTISDMRKFYSACDCLVFPSKFENLSLVILEALSSGLPIIATNRGGNIDQVIDGENGFLIEPENHIELAAAMRKYLEYPAIINGQGVESRKIAKNKFSVDVMVKKVEELYLELLY